MTRATVQSSEYAVEKGADLDSLYLRKTVEFQHRINIEPHSDYNITLANPFVRSKPHVPRGLRPLGKYGTSFWPTKVRRRAISGHNGLSRPV